MGHSNTAPKCIRGIKDSPPSMRQCERSRLALSSKMHALLVDPANFQGSCPAFLQLIEYGNHNFLTWFALPLEMRHTEVLRYFFCTLCTMESVAHLQGRFFAELYSLITKIQNFQIRSFFICSCMLAYPPMGCCSHYVDEQSNETALRACTWTQDYSQVFAHGDLLRAEPQNNSLVVALKFVIQRSMFLMIVLAHDGHYKSVIVTKAVAQLILTS